MRSFGVPCCFKTEPWFSKRGRDKQWLDTTLTAAPWDIQPWMDGTASLGGTARTLSCREEAPTMCNTIHKDNRVSKDPTTKGGGAGKSQECSLQTRGLILASNDTGLRAYRRSEWRGMCNHLIPVSACPGRAHRHAEGIQPRSPWYLPTSPLAHQPEGDLQGPVHTCWPVFECF